MVYTQEHIELMDKVFDFCIEKKQGNCGCNSFIQSHKVKRQAAEFAYNEVCKVGQELGVFISEHFSGGDWGIISIDYLKADEFKKKGGFKGYFKWKEETKIPREE